MKKKWTIDKKIQDHIDRTNDLITRKDVEELNRVLSADYPNDQTRRLLNVFYRLDLSKNYYLVGPMEVEPIDGILNDMWNNVKDFFK